MTAVSRGGRFVRGGAKENKRQELDIGKRMEKHSHNEPAFMSVHWWETQIPGFRNYTRDYTRGSGEGVTALVTHMFGYVARHLHNKDKVVGGTTPEHSRTTWAPMKEEHRKMLPLSGLAESRGKQQHKSP